MKEDKKSESFEEGIIEQLKQLPYFGHYWNLNSPGLQQGYFPADISINYNGELKNERR